MTSDRPDVFIVLEDLTRIADQFAEEGKLTYKVERPTEQQVLCAKYHASLEEAQRLIRAMAARAVGITYPQDPA